MWKLFLLLISITFLSGCTRVNQSVTLAKPSSDTTSNSNSNEPSSELVETKKSASELNTTNSALLNRLLTRVEQAPLANYRITDFNVARTGQMWWVSPDHWSVLVPASGDIGFSEVTAYDDLNVKNSQVNKFIQELSVFFKEEGFVSSIVNSSSSVVDKQFYDYILGWEGKNEKCVLIISPDNGSYYNESSKRMVPFQNVGIKCVSKEDYEKAYAEQTPYLRGLGDRKAVISHIQAKGNVATMAINWRRSGAQAFMYKSQGLWKKILVSQAEPLCAELEKGGIPKEYWIACFDSKNQQQKKAGSAWSQLQ